MENIVRGLFGILFLVGLGWLLSTNRRSINWRAVLIGIGLQLIFGLLVLKVPLVRVGFDFVSSFIVAILDFTYQGSLFVFGSLVDKSKTDTLGFIFAFRVLPTIIFFSALTSVLFYFGILQKIVYAFAWVMAKTMGLSGAESLSAAANVFMGQTEAPLLVKPYIEKMTNSELLCLMIGGMATIAGGVMAAYVGFLGGNDPVQQQLFATHLLTASIMNAPAAVVASKLLLPETEVIDTNLQIASEKVGSTALEALTIGTSEGLKLAVNVGAMLISFIALIAMINYILGDIIGSFTGLNSWIADSTDGHFAKLSLQYVLGQICRPIAFIVGVDWKDSLTIGSLLGEKTAINEFVAYISLSKIPEGVISFKSKLMATYMLCGFANLSSIAIQIGGIGSLAPNRRGDLSRFGFRALLGGVLACLLTGSVAGMFVG